VHNIILLGIIANVPFGSKAFWVTPLLNPSATFPGCSALERFEQLSNLLPGKVGLLHGQMDSNSKQETIDKFTKGQISILVATTVIEVGVDIPDASICVIDQAGQFGLSQLHQIRGRVGRGIPPQEEKLIDAICILLYRTKNDISDGSLGEEIPHERLRLLEESTDGFQISEADLLLRGPGDFFGSRQHGISNIRCVLFDLTNNFFSL
jgi:ATP-dependent DNA helicase RecG